MTENICNKYTINNTKFDIDKYIFNIKEKIEKQFDICNQNWEQLN